MNIFQELNNKKVDYSVVKAKESESVLFWRKLGSNYYLRIRNDGKSKKLDCDQIVYFRNMIKSFNVIRDNKSVTVYKNEIRN